MSAVVALKYLRIVREAHPHIDEAAVLHAARSLSADHSVHDFERALELDAALQVDLRFDEFEADLRRLLAAVVADKPPYWAPVVLAGRDRVFGVLAANNSLNELQLLRSAGLFESPASDDVVSWWDVLASAQRSFRDEANLDTGRHGERKSLAWERARLAAAGCQLQPQWVAIDDSQVGYDVRSWTLRDGAWHPLAIEVKSTTQAHRRFHLTRNEYQTALTLGDDYLLHLWTSQSTEPFVLSAAEVVAHCPTDAGAGRWQDVLVTL